MAEQEERRRRKRDELQRETFTVVILQLMRIWVLGEAGMPPVGGSDDGKTGDDSSGVAESTVERESEERETLQKKKNRVRGWFFLIFLPQFLLLRLSKPPLFIDSGRGQSFLCWGKILALDSLRKDPNCWLKVVMVHCQNYRNSCLSWHV